MFRRVFRLPGRSAIDAMASWLAAAAVGILITSQQYESGFYSRARSIGHRGRTLDRVHPVRAPHREHDWYRASVLPLLRYRRRRGARLRVGRAEAPAAQRHPGTATSKASANRFRKNVPDDVSLFRWGWRQASERKGHRGPKALARISAANVLDIWFSLTPGVIAVGGLGLMIAEYTPVMRYLSYPLVPVLELLRIPEAAAAAPALLVGFLEMFLPAVIASGIESELTRFVVACMSIVQLIYMSEVGILLLKSPIPLRLVDLVAIFLVRTAVALPVVAAIAHFVVF